MLLVGREPDPPYNRPNCSKGYLRGEETREEPLFRPDEWWAEQNIELLTRTSVTGLDLQSRTAKLSTKEEVEFEQGADRDRRERAPAERRAAASSSRSTTCARSATPTRSARAWRTPSRWC